MTRKHLYTAPLAFAGLLLSAPALAQEAAAPEAVEAVSGGTAYIFNTLLFLIGGFLVMWMAAGFAMLEAGLVRSKNVSVQCLKNIGLYSIAGLMFWVIGYSIAYPGFEGGFFGIADFPYAFPSQGIHHLRIVDQGAVGIRLAACLGFLPIKVHES